jgi:hypothetical protein
MQVAAIIPCRGRAEQTVENARRLLATAGLEHGREWMLYLAGGATEGGTITKICGRVADLDRQSITIATAAEPQITYWQALKMVTQVTDYPLLASLANDLWACDDWLKIAALEYRDRFGDGPGLLGFAGDGHGYSHSCHFLISRSLLDRYGGWPTWYQHNFGDAELCTRAQQDGLYAKSERAYLEHCHVARGLAPDDAVYQAGRATYRQDEALFAERRRLGWPLVSPL